MFLSQFFGDKSPFDVLSICCNAIIAIVAITTGIYTLYKNFFERANLSIYPGDRLGLVISKDGGCRKIQLHANLVNHAVKTGTLHHLEAEITDPEGTKNRYNWLIFFDYKPGEMVLIFKSFPYPLSIAGKTSQLLLVELENNTTATPSWSTGRYRVELIGWVNLKNRNQPPNLKQMFQFDITQSQSQDIIQPRQTQLEALVMEVPVSEWWV
jgi:hypothetical protein